MIGPLYALLVEELALHSADGASGMLVVGPFAEQEAVAMAYVLVHHRLALVGLVAALHSSQSSSSSHACCVSYTAQLNDRAHRTLDRKQQCTVNICTRCPMGANANHVHQGLDVHRMLQQPLELVSSHSLERAAAAALAVGTAD